jgi:hypothetical protein
MSIKRIAIGRIVFIIGVFVIATTAGSGACIVDEIPACPGQCFEYTVEYVHLGDLYERVFDL